MFGFIKLTIVQPSKQVRLSTVLEVVLKKQKLFINIFMNKEVSYIRYMLFSLTFSSSLNSFSQKRKGCVGYTSSEHVSWVDKILAYKFRNLYIPSQVNPKPSYTHQLLPNRKAIHLAITRSQLNPTLGRVSTTNNPPICTLPNQQ